MSYLRMGHPLSWFKGDSHSYVYVGEGGVVDYDDKYEDTPTLIELIGTIIERETGDSEFATKIVRTLAAKFNIIKQLRDQPLTMEELLAIYVQRYGPKD